MKIPFYKMQGAGNDFVTIDHRSPFLPATRAPLVARMCDRRRGVGADGVLLLEADRSLDFAMTYYNADGGPADFCGNGARCLAHLAFALGLGRGGEVTFRTAVGPMRARHAADGIRVEVGPVDPAGPEEEVEAGGHRFRGRRVAPGVPHFVTWTEHVEAVPLAEWGRALRRHERFVPQGSNVDFAARVGSGEIAMRTYERGVEGETLACGSGAIACALAAAAEGAGSPQRVRTAGGDALIVDWERENGRWRVALSGPTTVSFTGVWNEEG
jgi:diaminopimelate epimerase